MSFGAYKINSGRIGFFHEVPEIYCHFEKIAVLFFYNLKHPLRNVPKKTTGIPGKSLFLISNLL